MRKRKVKDDFKDLVSGNWEKIDIAWDSSIHWENVRKTDISNWGVEEAYQEFSVKYFRDPSADVEKAVRYTSLELKWDIRTENVHLGVSVYGWFSKFRVLSLNFMSLYNIVTILISSFNIF